MSFSEKNDKYAISDPFCLVFELPLWTPALGGPWRNSHRSNSTATSFMPPQCASHLLPQDFSMNAGVWENKRPSYCLSTYIPEARSVIPACKPRINCWWIIFLPFSLWVHVSYDFSRSSKQSLLAFSFNNTSLHWALLLPCSILLVPDFCFLGFYFLIGACTEPLAQGLILANKAEALHLTHAFLTTLPLGTCKRVLILGHLHMSYLLPDLCRNGSFMSFWLLRVLLPHKSLLSLRDLNGYPTTLHYTFWFNYFHRIYHYEKF